MSNPALMMAISGSLHYTPAASASPVLVQQAVSLGSAITGTLTVTLASAPVSGNTLVMHVSTFTTASMATPAGWTLVSSTFAGATSGNRYIFKRTADGTEGTTISATMPTSNSGFSVQEWQGSVTVTPAEGGQTTSGTGSFAMGPFAAPASNAVPAVFGMFNGNSPTSTAAPPSGWASSGPLPNGSFPQRGQVVAYGPATASALSAKTFTYTGTRGDGISVLWVGAWIA
jgi:hypothetical protein